MHVYCNVLQKQSLQYVYMIHTPTPDIFIYQFNVYKCNCNVATFCLACNDVLIFLFFFCCHILLSMY